MNRDNPVSPTVDTAPQDPDIFDDDSLLRPEFHISSLSNTDRPPSASSIQASTPLIKRKRRWTIVSSTVALIDIRVIATPSRNPLGHLEKDLTITLHHPRTSRKPDSQSQEALFHLPTKLSGYRTAESAKEPNTPPH
ncbi:hypothetical protein Z517_04677 [Fonsecaea pedrosoi CBS 271.37]|uniref:Uncharacterized protein n=1 Tax=Fonsecaea pedrosoi CBS 271.37 TaxID=1442368 RepID=A0A0D2DUZ1_9EURO|nr:uncharacterized protein Z517_04677 [Fonsecaea pedrosoi CBS 271.37]KIW81651.1 hypothetical protein Z517_04677 [Fonsecaea pedrosoi CBS 271.37]